MKQAAVFTNIDKLLMTFAYFAQLSFYFIEQLKQFSRLFISLSFNFLTLTLTLALSLTCSVIALYPLTAVPSKT